MASAGIDQAYAERVVMEQQARVAMTARNMPTSGLVQPDPVGVYQHAQRLIEEIAETRDLFSILEERLGHGLKSAYPEHGAGCEDQPSPNRCPAASTLDMARAELAQLRAYIRSVTERVDL